MAASFGSKHFIYHTVVNVLLPRTPRTMTSATACKFVHLTALAGLFLLSKEGRELTERVYNGVHNLLRMGLDGNDDDDDDDGDEDDDEDDEALIVNVPEVPPNSPENRSPAASNASSGCNTPRMGSPSRSGA
ncbi:hypothetical protein FQN54_000463 [Arachnomyces sp. PD_36]|nr:hypothetical protein FQN54_000463 [Arachnomyces sp. PD_36]